MPELDLGSVIGPQGPKGDKGIDGAVGPMGPQGEKGDDGAAASINGVNALTMTTGDGLEATMNGSAYHLKLTDNALNAVQVVPTLVRPNLLDNWYFGDPVDQRGGKIIQSGVNIYTDSALKTLIGPAAYACPVVELTSTYAKVQDAKNAGSYYYAAPGDVVRGYTGSGYTVDRWSLYTDGGSTTISTGYLDIYSTKQYGAYLAQKIDPELAKALAGKTVTYSVLAADGDTAFSANINKSGAYLDSFTIEPNAVSCKTWTFPTDSTDVVFNFAGNAAGHVRPIAAKLELGPTQTLAHQDSAGNWVLNEVPEYGEQLRRCQRYFVRINNVYASGHVATSNSSFVDFTMPVPLRTNPVLTVRNKGVLTSAGISVATSEIALAAREENHIYLGVTTTATLTTSHIACLHDASIDFSADL